MRRWIAHTPFSLEIPEALNSARSLLKRHRSGDQHVPQAMLESRANARIQWLTRGAQDFAHYRRYCRRFGVAATPTVEQALFPGAIIANSTHCMVAAVTFTLQKAPACRGGLLRRCCDCACGGLSARRHLSNPVSIRASFKYILPKSPKGMVDPCAFRLRIIGFCVERGHAPQRPFDSLISTAGNLPILALIITSLSGGETRHHACFVVRCQRQLRRAPLERFDCPAAPPTSCWSRESRQRSEIAAGLPTGHRVASRHSSASVSVQFPGQPASARDPAPRLATRPVSIARCEALCSRGRSGFLLGLYPLKVRFAQRAF